MKAIVIMLLIKNVLVSCTAQNVSGTTKFTSEIPIAHNGEPDLFYNLTQQLVTQLDIDTLHSGYDSLQIRIWYNYSLLNLKKVLVLKKNKSDWTATIFLLNAGRNASNQTVSDMNERGVNTNPRNGWSNFLSKLFALKITSLPNMNDIPGFTGEWNDGLNYCVEVATKTSYRFYSYNNPDKFQKKYLQAKNMMDILKLIEIEFGLKWDYEK